MTCLWLKIALYIFFIQSTKGAKDRLRVPENLIYIELAKHFMQKEFIELNIICCIYIYGW